MEKVNELKVKAYDLISDMEQAQNVVRQIQQALAKVNQEIAKELYDSQKSSQISIVEDDADNKDKKNS